MINKIKVPLLVTLVVIVVRILLEEMGAPGAISNIFSVAWLAFLIPIYFAVGMAAREEAHPYKALVKLIVLYGVGVRLMVAVSYSLAYLFQWSAPRFSGGGVVGEEVDGTSGTLADAGFQYGAWINHGHRFRSAGWTCGPGHSAQDAQAQGDR